MQKPRPPPPWIRACGFLCLVFIPGACESARTIPIDKTNPAVSAAPATPRAHTNRLAGEKSPYLLQHAHNPVDWYPWGAEACARARRENKPIFLSIGYSTCHWCHVMEHESFENPAVARLLNDYFVAVKVDREERPDLDQVYMTFVQASTGSGGWPMTVLLTPDLKPFFGGTYFPPDDTSGRPGLKTVLLKMHELWVKDRAKITQSAENATQFLQELAAPRAPEEGAISPGTFAAAYAEMRSSYDPQCGGFGRAPKFPQPVMLNFLLREFWRTGESSARDMVLQTLLQMAQGGIHDHLGGGFHRYATDQRWFLPHFEKMLYDQAQLAAVCLDAWQLSHEPFYADTARDILDYVLRDLTGDAGQFYSAEDADSAPDPARSKDKKEGAYYVWSIDEMARVLGPSVAPLFNYRYGVEPEGNVERDPFQEFRGKNVLYEAHSLAETAARFEISPAETVRILTAARLKLLAVRCQRPRPHLDDKTLTAWNGLMISALARAGPILDEPRYSAAAARAAAFLRAKLYNAQTHTLQRRWRDGQAQGPGFLDDYAFFIQSLLDLYESTLDVEWLKLALNLQARQDELFWDQEQGGYFTTTACEPNVLVRMKDSADGAEPAGNSIAVLNLLRLVRMTDDSAWRDRADRTLRYFSGRVRQYPANMPQMLVAAEFAQNQPLQIVLAGKPDGADTRALLGEINRHYLPHKIILAADGAEGLKFLSTRVEFLKQVSRVDGRAAAYVCQNFTCQQPTTDPAVLRTLLGERKTPQSPSQKITGERAK